MTAPDTTESEQAAERIVGGFGRLCQVLRSMMWAQGQPRGLTPTQTQILGLLRNHGASRLSRLADELGVRQPTASEAVGALVRKRLVERSTDPRDARAVVLQLTEEGKAEGKRASGAPAALVEAVDGLSACDQTALLCALTKIIRTLQVSGEIAPAKLCVTCRYFQPFVHDGAAPHHCRLVDAAFGDRALRLDCPEQEPDASEEAEVNWLNFVAGPRPAADPSNG